MILVKYHGRLGNNLFQYALGRILAEELGRQLIADPLPGFVGTNDVVGGVVYDQHPLVFDNQTLPLEELLATQPKQQIILNGYFQQYAYYHPFKDRIKQWFRLPEATEKAGRNDIVFFIRRGDYYFHKSALPRSFYMQIAERHAYENMWVCTDDPLDPFITDFCKKTGAVVRKKSPLEDFAFSQTAGHMCLSQSTFAWWVAFLSEAKTIYFPLPKEGLWHTKDNRVHLQINDEERYVYIAIEETYAPTMREMVYIWRYYGWQYFDLQYVRLRNWVRRFLKGLRKATNDVDQNK